MKLGLFPKLTDELKKALVDSGNGPVPKCLTDYCFASVGRKIRMEDIEIGVILQTRVLLDYQNPETGKKERRVYSVIQVFPAQEKTAEAMLKHPRASKHGLLDFTT